MLREVVGQLEEVLQLILTDPRLDRSAHLPQLCAQLEQVLPLAEAAGDPVATAVSLRLYAVATLFLGGEPLTGGRAALAARRACRLLREPREVLDLEDAALACERGKALAARGGVLDALHADRSRRGMAAAHACFARAHAAFQSAGLALDAARQIAQAAGSSVRLGRWSSPALFARAEREYDLALALGGADLTPAERAAWEGYRCSAQGERFAAGAAVDAAALRKSFNRALRAVDADANDRVRASIRLNFAGFLLESRTATWRADHVEALALLDAAYGLAERDAGLRAAIALSLAHAWISHPAGALTPNIEAAITWGEIARSGFADSAAPLEQARAAQNLAEAYAMRVGGDRLDNRANARALIRTARRLARCHGDQALRARLASSTGRVEMFHALPGPGRIVGLRRAARWLRAAIRSLPRRSAAAAADAVTLAHVLVELARLSGDDAILAEALERSADAYAEFAQLGDDEAARRALVVQGRCRARAGAWPEARDLFARAAALLGDDTLGPVSGAARAIGTGGEMFGHLAYAAARCGALHDAFAAVLSARGRALVQATGRRRLTLGQLIDRSPAGTVYLAPLFDPEGSLLLLAHGLAGSVEVEEIELDGINADDLTAAVFGDGRLTEGWAPMLETADLRDIGLRLTDVLSWMSEWVTAPLAAWLAGRGARHVVLLPTGASTILPWGAAIDAIDDTLDLTHAAALCEPLEQDIENGAIAGEDLILVPDPTGSLAAAAAECRTIAALAGRTARLLDPSMVSAETLHEAAQTARFLHFAGHGAFDPYDPRNAHLVLAGGLLGGDTIARFRLRKSAVVTLTACETGVTDFAERGDETIGLASAWLAAGAQAVVGALWQVSDIAAALFGVALYRLLLAGVGVERAVRLAGAKLAELPMAEAVAAAEALGFAADEVEAIAATFGEDQRPLRTPISGVPSLSTA